MEQLHKNLARSIGLEEKLIRHSAYKNSAKLALADYRNEKKLLETGMITNEDFELYQALVKERLDKLSDGDISDLDETKPKERASLFLSYNHQDQEMAKKIREELDGYRVKVSMDVFDVEPGQDIKEFIIHQTRGNNGIMLLISKNSLTSQWVSYETALGMFDQVLNGQNIYYLILDSDCMSNDFSRIAFTEIDSKIDLLRKEIKDYEKKGWGTLHFQTDVQGYIDARHQLPAILQKLKTKAVNTIVGDNFKTTLRKIAEQLIK